MTKPAALLILLLPLAACNDAIPEEPVTVATPAPAIEDITAEQWDALAARRFFFGHQSVGRDVMLGMERVLAKHPQVRLRLVQSAEPGSVAGPAFIEARIGTNTKPATKDSAFVQALAQGFGEEAGSVAMLKYCYADVLNDDPDTLFASYVAQVEALRERYPELVIVHFTMPLQEVKPGLKESLGAALGLRNRTTLNVKRQRYNDLLRERYGGTEPLFDIAEIQSTRADGTRSYIRHKGRTIYTLASEWTYDGGHLTDPAQDRVAERLLVFLAQLAPGVAGATPPQALK